MIEVDLFKKSDNIYIKNINKLRKGTNDDQKMLKHSVHHITKQKKAMNCTVHEVSMWDKLAVLYLNGSIESTWSD